MKLNLIRPILIWTIFLAILSCNGNQRVSDTTWESKYHNIAAEYSTPWSRLLSVDTEDKTLFGVIDNSDGKSYIIKITKDVSKDLLSDEQYYQATRDLMLNENTKNKLLEETDTTFHGQIFRRQTFLLYTDKWGLLKQYANVCRLNNNLIGVQISFPVSEQTAETETMPQVLIDLDKKIKINNK